jgi:hypothetical protein
LRTSRRSSPTYIADKTSYSKFLSKLKDEVVYSFGDSSVIGADAIASLLTVSASASEGSEIKKGR